MRAACRGRDSRGSLTSACAEGAERERRSGRVADNLTYDAEANARHWAALDQLYQAHLQES